MITANIQTLRFDEEFSQTYPVAVLIPDMAEIAEKNPHLYFAKSLDDLDYLWYCILDLSIEVRVALVCHENSPIPGVDVCVDQEREDIPRVLVSTLSDLGFNDNALSWIHPDYLSEFHVLWKSHRLEIQQVG
jgi:hypothetical protein